MRVSRCWKTKINRIAHGSCRLTRFPGRAVSSTSTLTDMGCGVPRDCLTRANASEGLPAIRELRLRPCVDSSLGGTAFSSFATRATFADGFSSSDSVSTFAFLLLVTWEGLDFFLCRVSFGSVPGFSLATPNSASIIRLRAMLASRSSA